MNREITLHKYNPIGKKDTILLKKRCIWLWVMK